MGLNPWIDNDQRQITAWIARDSTLKIAPYRVTHWSIGTHSKSQAGGNNADAVLAMRVNARLESIISTHAVDKFLRTIANTHELFDHHQPE